MVDPNLLFPEDPEQAPFCSSIQADLQKAGFPAPSQIQQPLGECSADEWWKSQWNFWSFAWNNIWLVVWNMNFMTFHILGIVIQLTFIFFRGVETTNQIWWPLNFSEPIEAHHAIKILDSRSSLGILGMGIEGGQGFGLNNQCEMSGSFKAFPWTVLFPSPEFDIKP